MIKTYCDICGEEITDLDITCRYKIKKLVKLIAERRDEHADNT